MILHLITVLQEGGECKLLMMEFFNSLMIVWSLHGVQEYSRYA